MATRPAVTAVIQPSNAGPVRYFRARDGARISDAEAAAAAQFLVERFGDLGAPTDAIVEAARPDDSPIHKHFTWEDEEAARQYRRDQARKLVASIQVVGEAPDGEQIETRAFQLVMVEGENRYVPEHIVWSTPDLAKQALTSARRELRSAAEKAAQYEELAAVALPVIDQLNQLDDGK